MALSWWCCVGRQWGFENSSLSQVTLRAPPLVFLLPPPRLPLAVCHSSSSRSSGTGSPDKFYAISCCWRWCFFYHSSRKTNNTGVSVPDGQVLPEGFHTRGYLEILLIHSTRTSGCKGWDLGFLRLEPVICISRER